MGMKQASEQAFYQRIQSCRIIKMVISCFQWKTREVIIFTYQIYKRKRFLTPKPEQVRSKNNS